MRLSFAHVFLLLSAALAASGPAAAGVRGAPLGTLKNYRQGEVLVKYRASVARKGSHRAYLTARGARVLKALGDEGLMRVRVPDGQSVEDAVRSLGGSEGVEFAQPNFTYRKTATVNDTQYPQQWHLKNTGQTIAGAYYPSHNPGASSSDIGAETAWNTITDCSSVTVAVIDSGVNYNHEDLSANMWNGGTSYPKHGYDFADGDNDPMDLDGHGTHVAGLIGARGNNGVGTSGVCWRASIMALRALDASGSGNTADIVSSIDFAIANGAKIINMSLGQAAYDSALAAAVTRATNAGLVVVVAAGNDGKNNESSPVYPCNLTNANLICVAALDQSFALTSFSNYGVSSVDVGAPGANIQSLGTGVSTTQADTFATGWTSNSSTWSGGLGPLPGGGSYPMMRNPATWNRSTAKYVNSLDARVYKSFNLNGADAATVEFYGYLDTLSGDGFSVAYRTSAGDPFAAGGTTVENVSGSTNGSDEPFAYDLSGCRVSPCSIGFRLSTNASGVDFGVSVLDFKLTSLTLNTNSYENMSGTSMATPVVAGIAAMVMAYNPSYTAADVVASVKAGGALLPGLSGKTTTSRAVSASGSLQYIAPPTGCAASVN
jgi:thermitase